MHRKAMQQAMQKGGGSPPKPCIALQCNPKPVPCIPCIPMGCMGCKDGLGSHSITLKEGKPHRWNEGRQSGPTHAVNLPFNPMRQKWRRIPSQGHKVFCLNCLPSPSWWGREGSPWPIDHYIVDTDLLCIYVYELLMLPKNVTGRATKTIRVVALANSSYPVRGTRFTEPGELLGYQQGGLQTKSAMRGHP